MRGLLDEHGLECWGAVTLMTAGRDLLDQDPYVRRGSVEYVKDTLTFVSELGGKIVTVVPSTVGKTVPMASPGRGVGAGRSSRSSAARSTRRPSACGSRWSR